LLIGGGRSRGRRLRDARTAGIEKRHRSWRGWILALALLAIAVLWLPGVRNDRNQPQTVGVSGISGQHGTIELTGVPGVL
jgi:hypothetical protein